MQESDMARHLHFFRLTGMKGFPHRHSEEGKVRLETDNPSTKKEERYGNP